VQTGLLRALHALGLTDTVAGQPAWPFTWRIATETLLIDRGLARQLAWALAFAAFALVLLLAGALWRRARWPAWALAVIAALLVPWPPLALVLTDAVPTSFHRSPSNFDAASIARGLDLYDTHCASCHGRDGRGEGPAAAALPVWPPTLSAGLLWKRAEGELLWRVLHGMRDRTGATTMPDFAGALNETEVWALLDAMKAVSAGDSAQRDASWPWPVQAPAVEVDCVDQAPRRLAQWRGQRVRIVAADDTGSVPRDDPRVVTVVLRRKPAGTRVDCGVSGADAWRAYARVAGVPETALAGTQFIVDRDGWLRALGRPGQTDWSENSLLCRADAPPTDSRAPSTDGLGALIARMDADPVQAVRGGLAHAR
jgi:mono/diheme cytochrome c family protein